MNAALIFWFLFYQEKRTERKMNRPLRMMAYKPAENFLRQCLCQLSTPFSAGLLRLFMQNCNVLDQNCGVK